jgi:hypothetical protein
MGEARSIQLTPGRGPPGVSGRGPSSSLTSPAYPYTRGICPTSTTPTTSSSGPCT